MCSLFRKVVAVLAVMLAAAGVALSQSTLKVCADPANLPFSSQNKAGFENRIATLLAKELNSRAEFYWGRMGRGFLREVLNKGKCDVLLGVPVGMRGLLVSRPYYRSSYVFVTRNGQNIQSLDDAALKNMKIGVQVLDDDYAPPARALSRRGMASNIVGFDMEDPAAIVRAVANKKVDAAIVWGPVAGYYVKRYGAALKLAPVVPEIDPPGLPLAYEIAAGVSKSKPELLERVNSALARAQPEIRKILRSYNIPTLPKPDTTVAAGGAR
jgi:mxaJ protein